MKIRSSLVSNSSSSSFLMLGYGIGEDIHYAVNKLIDPDFPKENNIPECEEDKYWEMYDEYHDQLYSGLKIDGIEDEIQVVDCEDTIYIGLQLAYGLDEMAPEEFDLKRLLIDLEPLAAKLDRSGEKPKLIAGSSSA